MTDLDKLEALAKAVQEVCDLLENMAGADEVTEALYVSFNGTMRHWRDAMNDAADLLQDSARRDAEEIERLKRELAAADGRTADYRTVAINQGWNWRMCDAYGREEYAKHRGEHVDACALNAAEARARAAHTGEG